LTVSSRIAAAKNSGKIGLALRMRCSLVPSLAEFLPCSSSFLGTLRCYGPSHDTGNRSKGIVSVLLGFLPLGRMVIVSICLSWSVLLGFLLRWHRELFFGWNTVDANVGGGGVTRKIWIIPLTRERVLNTFKYKVRTLRDCD
jgi:hypothetical protein